ncbi:hypothetical protein TWF506_003426 [Arthrobotrys conoides]|uniref:Uncharacterized protein n=1 Tax=Arthrobotrys conoides TaxID=74498 RepID=A0AAN8NB72_9PEZI
MMMMMMIILGDVKVDDDVDEVEVEVEIDKVDCSIVLPEGNPKVCCCEVGWVEGDFIINQVGYKVKREKNPGQTSQKGRGRRKRARNCCKYVTKGRPGKGPGSIISTGCDISARMGPVCAVCGGGREFCLY